MQSFHTQTHCQQVCKSAKVYSTRYSQAVTHPSTDRARRCLTSVIRREPVYSTWYGRRRRGKSKTRSGSTIGKFLGSIVVSILACHARDRGSIPRRGEIFGSFFPSISSFSISSSRSLVTFICRDSIVVSTLRCGRNNPGSNPGHGTFFFLKQTLGQKATNHGKI